MKRSAAVLIFAALAGGLAAMPLGASADVSFGVSITAGPPALPYYPQPFCPGPGFIWTPGYWAYGAYGYYWVPGTWVLAPVGLLWTPGWWGWRAGYYVWHAGYWGPHVGFYGGINYGYGYTGVGFIGGYWRGNAFYYNRAVARVNLNYVRTTYAQPAPPIAAVSRVSYNGGQGGLTARPTTQEQAYAQEQHRAALPQQLRQQRSALNRPAQRYSANNGRPGVAATTRPNGYNGRGAVRLNAAGDGYNYRHPGPPRMRYGRPVRPPSPPPMARHGGPRRPPRR